MLRLPLVTELGDGLLLAVGNEHRIKAEAGLAACLCGDPALEGAQTFGYQTVQPDFSGHELCTSSSYVQGPSDPAPLHPNARGQLVIALADERALLGAP